MKELIFLSLLKLLNKLEENNQKCHRLFIKFHIQILFVIL